MRRIVTNDSNRNSRVVLDEARRVVLKVMFEGTGFERERDAHKALEGCDDMRHVVRCMGVEPLPKQGFHKITLEYCSLGSLRRFGSQPRDADTWFSVIFQVLYGLHTLHRLQLCHGDTHCGNILMRRRRPEDSVRYTVGGATYTLPRTGACAVVADFDTVTSDAAVWQQHADVHHFLNVLCTSSSYGPPAEVVDAFFTTKKGNVYSKSMHLGQHTACVSHYRLHKGVTAQSAEDVIASVYTKWRHDDAT